MNVLVATPNRRCPATLALLAEEINAETVLVKTDQDYGRAFTAAWRNGGFINVEHDVVPWPGAIRSLETCPHDFCGFGYPMRNRGNLTYSLGCTKFSERMTVAHPGLPDRWDGASWWELDAHVFAAITDVYGSEDFHVPEPPVAHVKEYVGLIPTSDPDTFIEEQHDGYVRYRNIVTGKRHEVHGVCDQRGDCIIGAVIDTPDGPIQIRDHAHIDDLKHQLNVERLVSDLDVPVGPGFTGCCPLTVAEL